MFDGCKCYGEAGKDFRDSEVENLDQVIWEGFPERWHFRKVKRKVKE